MVAEAVESAVAAAYRKEFGKRGENIKAEINFKTGSFKFWKIRTVVDETTVRVKEEGKEPEIEDKSKESEKELLPLYNSERHIFLDEAKAVKSDVKIDEELEFPLEEREDFGRIAAQAAKQGVLQKIREKSFQESFSALSAAMFLSTSAGRSE